jgi:Bacterial self-protective colicin-like immunity
LAVREPQSIRAALEPYGALLRMLVEGRIAAAEFEAVFLPLYKNDPTAWPPAVFDILDGVFADVDEFCADPALLAAGGGIDAAELRRRAEVAYARLLPTLG